MTVVRDRLAGNALEQLLPCAVGLFDNAYPFGQSSAHTLRHRHLNLPWVYETKVVHGQNTVAVYYRSSTDEGDGLSVMVVWRWDMMIESIDASTTPLKPAHCLPRKHLLAMNAKLGGFFNCYETMPVSSGFIELFKITHANMIPFSGSICQARSTTSLSN